MSTKKTPPPKGVNRLPTPTTAMEGSPLGVYISPPHGPAAPSVKPGSTALTDTSPMALHRGQTQTLQVHSPKRYRIGRALGDASDSSLPTEVAEQLVVLRQGNDVWLHTAQNATLVLSGFFAAPGSQLQLDFGPDSWHLDGPEAGQALAGTDAQLLYWRGQADDWPQELLSSADPAMGDFAWHKTQFTTLTPPTAEALPTAPAGTTAASAAPASAAATATSAGAAASGGMGAAALGMVGAVGMAAALGNLFDNLAVQLSSLRQWAGHWLDWSETHLRAHALVWRAHAPAAP